MTAAAPRLGWFSGFGIEIEYAVVDRETLDVRPIVDQVLREDGEVVAELCRGALCWSNELVAHVLELKCNGPARDLEPLSDWFARDVRRVNALLEPHGARLMPSAMHPLMDPSRETLLWPHEQGEIYQAFDRMFGCRGHGWSNLQSMHVNLPFADEGQFGRLHAAIRLVLPILPTLAASSPFVEGRATGSLDNRLEFYRGNCALIPSITGRVIPEPVFDERTYRGVILERIARDVAPFDAGGVLEAEWVNARGAIARFDRGSIEIRVIDTQECPSADLAVAALAVGAVRALAEERWSSFEVQRAWSDERLESILLRAVADGSRAVIDDSEYLETFRLNGRRARHGIDLWRELADALTEAGLLHASVWQRPLAVLFARGCLASRLRAAAGPDLSREALVAVYRELCDCLDADCMFEP